MSALPCVVLFDHCFEIKSVGKGWISDDTAIFSRGSDNETITE